ncbi:MAG: carboxypeptidase-like regulatory domain-containing protein [candidate division KSB1 bacterium]|nr:carboxypeptidase-like regulatory domain-containing protein [candidate division KSB1 bacterium]MDZ7364838.1 carboxypeptidase-like regulatory domain-containing protein [candidate division KSB1 bacterium]MDZ7402941.1 carboxypeptidase-like regulatory domain-containing protein [candidate division KSB1 bacterium]
MFFKKNDLPHQCLIGLLSLLIYSCHLFAQAQPQFQVSGVVLDADTGQPLPSANVFLANTMKGGVTDSAGRFVIPNVPAGTFDLVVSRLGYEVVKREIQVAGELEITPAFKLRPLVLTGEDVEVTAPAPKKWKAQLERFTELLLSTTSNAKKTKILNPEVLDFSEENDGLMATASAPLLIENRALGYELNLVLVEFVASSQKLAYKGSIKFDELSPSSGKEADEWRKNRLRTYQGSLRHFLAALSDTTIGPVMRLKQEGFEIFTFKFLWERETQRLADPLSMDRLFRRHPKTREMYLHFHDYLGVRYIHEREERPFLYYHHLTRDAGVQESWISLEGREVKIDQQGRYANDLAIAKFGYWAWERLADMLPYEYSP